MIIGITGGTGSGKTTLLKQIEARGAVVLDCDEIYHELLKTDRNMLDAIEARFPGTVENGTLDRKKLGAIVFADKEALLDLNRITHRAVREEVARRLAGHKGLAAVDAIGLFEGGLAELCDLTVAVTAPEEDRIRRLMAREGISREYAQSRIRAQKGEDFFRENCGRVLENDGTLEAFQDKCRRFLDEILD